MKRAGLMVAAGLLVSVAAYTTVFLAATSRQRAIVRSSQPELAWLRHEFHLDDGQYKKIEALHEDYKPTCLEMCRQIDEQNAKLHRLLTETNRVTPEIEAALADLARVRSRCQTTMLGHFYEVSHVMTPDQGRRYLDWVQGETILPARGVPVSPSGGHHSP